MLIALDELQDRIEGKDAVRGATYTCPACDSQVTLKRGAKIIAHFAHQPQSICRFAKGESRRHLEMKTQVGDWLRSVGEAFEYESMFGTVHRADVVWGRTVIECQASTLSVDEWEERTKFYNRTGFAVLWIWDIRRLFRDGIWSEEIRVPAEIRHCHQMSYGRIYAMDVDGEILDIHLHKATRGGEEYFVPGGYGETEWAAEYQPKSIRVPEIRPSSLQPHEKRGSQGHRLIWLDHHIWWTS